MAPKSPQDSAPEPRTIIEQPSFTTSARELKIADEAIKAALDHVRIQLVRMPEIFPQVPHTPLRRLKIQGYAASQPTIDVWFTFDEKHVYLHEIDFE